MSKKFELAIAITGDSKGAVQAVQLTDRELAKLARSANQHMKSIQSSNRVAIAGLRKMATVATAAVAAIGGLAKIRSVIDDIDQIGKMAGRLGTTTEALSELRHVANLSGVDFNQLQTGFQRMTRRISEAAGGTGEAVKALQELGLNARTLKQLRPEDQYERIADAINGLGNQSDKVRLAMRLFDTEGVALIQTMGNGAEGIREMRQEARDLGISLSSEMTQAAADANDNMTRLGTTFDAIGIQLTNALIPSINSAITTLLDLFNLRPERVVALDKIRDLKEQTDEMEQKLRAGVGLGRNAKAYESLYRQAVADLQTAMIAAETYGATQVQIDKALGKVAESTDKVTGSFNAAGTEQKAFENMLKSLRSPLEKFVDESEKLAKLYNAGDISLDAFNHNLAKYHDELQKGNGLDEHQRLINSLLSPTEKFIKNTEQLTRLYNKGEISLEAYTYNLAKYHDELGKNNAAEEAANLVEQLRTPTEKYVADTAKLAELYNANEISLETFTRGLAYYQDELSNSDQATQDLANTLTYELQFAFDTLLFSGQSFTDALGDMFDNMIDRMLHAAVRFASDKIIQGLFSGNLSQFLGGVGVGALAIGASYLFGGAGAPDRPADSRTTTAGDDRALGFAEIVAADIQSRDYYYARQLAQFNELNHTLKTELSVLTATGALQLDQFTDLTKSITGQLPPIFKDLAHVIETSTSGLADSVVDGLVGVFNPYDGIVQSGADAIGGAVSDAITPQIQTPVTGADVNQAVGDYAATQKLSAMASTLTAAYEVYNLISNWSNLSTFSQITGTISAVTSAVTAGIQIAAALGASVSTAVLSAIPVVGWIVAAVINIAQSIKMLVDGNIRGSLSQFFTAGLDNLLEKWVGFSVTDTLTFGMFKQRPPHARLKTAFSEGVYDPNFVYDNSQQYGDTPFQTKVRGSSARVRINTPLGTTSFGTFNADYSANDMVDMFGDLLLLIRDTDVAVVDAINNIDAAQGQAGETLAFYYDWLQKQGGGFSPKQDLGGLEVAELLQDRYKKIIDVLGESGTAAGVAFDRWFDLFTDKFGTENTLSIVQAVADNFDALMQLPANLIDLIDNNVKSFKLGGTPEDAAQEITKVLGAYASLSLGLTTLGANVNDEQIVSFLAHMNGIGFAVEDAGKSLLDYSIVLRSLNQNIAAGINELFAYAEAHAYANAQLSDFISTAGAFASLGLSLGLKTSFSDLESVSVIVGDIAETLLDQAERDALANQSSQYGTLTRTEIEQLGLATKDAILQVVNQVMFLNNALDAMGININSVGDSILQVVEISSELIDAMGGLEEAEKKFNNYFQHFYSDLERAGIAARQTAEAAAGAIASLGVAELTASNFRQIFESLLPTIPKEEKADWVNTWMDVGDAIGAANDAAETLANTLESELKSIIDINDATTNRYEQELQYIDRIRDYVDSLLLNDQLSPLTNKEQLIEAQSQFQTQLSAARAGDTDALQNITQYADAYLQNARTYYASGGDYSNIFKFVTDSLSGLDVTPANAASPDAAAIGKDIFDQTLALVQESQASTEQIIAALNNVFTPEQLQQYNIYGQGLDWFLNTIGVAGVNLDNFAAKLAEFTAGLSINDTELGYAQTAVDLYNANAASSGGQYQAVTLTAVSDQQIQDFVAANLNNPQVIYDIAQLYDISSDRLAANSPWTQQQILDWTTVQGLDDLPAFANGGDHLGGWRIVGERGPELEYTGPSRVFSHRDSQSLINVDALVGEIKQLREEVAQLRRERAEQTAALIESNYDANDRAAAKISESNTKTAEKSRWQSNAKVAPA